MPAVTVSVLDADLVAVFFDTVFVAVIVKVFLRNTKLLGKVKYNTYLMLAFHISCLLALQSTFCIPLALSRFLAWNHATVAE